MRPHPSWCHSDPSLFRTGDRSHCPRSSFPLLPCLRLSIRSRGCECYDWVTSPRVSGMFLSVDSSGIKRLGTIFHLFLPSSSFTPMKETFTHSFSSYRFDLRDFKNMGKRSGVSKTPVDCFGLDIPPLSRKYRTLTY